MANDTLKKQLAKMYTVSSLEARNKELNLGLGPPQPQQKWLLKLPAANGPGNDRGLSDPGPPASALTSR